MLMKYGLLLIGVIIGVQSYEICNFERHMCKWYHLHQCHFVHEKNKLLAGEKGYLYISKNICRKAGIYFYVERYMHMFQLHYFINGTGNGILAVSANYLFSGRHFLWSCSLNQGSQWQKADIFVAEEGFFDPMRHIYIEAFIRSGDITIAIGNISSNYGGHPVRRCSAARITDKPIISTTTTKRPTTNTFKYTTILQKTTNITTSSTKSKGYHSTQLTVSQTKAPKTILSQITTAEPVTNKSLVTTEQTAVSKQQRTQRTKHKDITTKPAVTPTTTNSLKPVSTTIPQQTTIIQDIKTLKTVSGGTNSKQQQLSPKYKQKGLIIGVSLFSIVLVTAVTVFIVLLHKKKIRIWNVQKQAQSVSGFENPVYQ